MNIIKKYIYLLVVLISITLLIVFRSVPSGHLWNDYSVLYVPEKISDDFVKNAFNLSGIDEFIGLNEQRVPVLLSENSMEGAMLKINMSGEANKYLSLRENYFFDISGEYKLYYVPERLRTNLDDCVTYLKKEKINAGIDDSYSYPWILPAVVCLLMIMLMIFSKNKLFFLGECLIPALYVFCNPFYSSATAVILLFLALFFISNLFGRDDAAKYLLKEIVIFLILIFSVVSTFASSLSSGFLFILTLCGTFSMIELLSKLKNHRESKMHFKPVYIRPAKMISVFGGNRKTVMPITIGCVVIIILYFALSSASDVSVNKKKKTIFIPGKAEMPESRLPTLEDFYLWSWNVFTSPLKSLNKSNYEDDCLVIPSYKVEEGIFTENDLVKYYNDDFRNQMKDEIDDFDFESIEKVLKSQGDEFTCGYVTLGSYHVSLFSIIMMFCCFGMLLFIYFSTMIKKRGGKK